MRMSVFSVSRCFTAHTHIHRAQYVVEKRKEVPLVLKLLPLSPAEGLPVEPDTHRPIKITVISTQPGVKPLAVGVTCKHKQTRQEAGVAGVAVVTS